MDAISRLEIHQLEPGDIEAVAIKAYEIRDAQEAVMAEDFDPSWWQVVETDSRRRPLTRQNLVAGCDDLLASRTEEERQLYFNGVARDFPHGRTAGQKCRVFHEFRNWRARWLELGGL
jgi:hypothetical protein